MKRLMCIALAALLLLPLAACSAQHPAGTASSDAVTGTSAAETTTEETTAIAGPDLPDTTFDGADFNIIMPKWSLYVLCYHSDGLDGDVLNDAIYARTLAVDEKLDISMNDTFVDSLDDIPDTVKKNVMAGDAVYDLVLTHCIAGMGGMVTDGLLTYWNDIPYIDLSKPYWNSSLTDKMTYNGMLPYAASDYILADPNIIVCNKSIAESYGMDSFYDKVRQGGWTWDYFMSQENKVYEDLNGDGVKNVGDKFGFYCECEWPLSSIMYSCGQFILENDGGSMKLCMDTEKMADIVRFCYKMIYEADGTITYNVHNDTDDSKTKIFTDGSALFAITSMSSVSALRQVDFDFGVLPLPKYDEAQQDYISINWSGMMCVPAVVKNIDLVGMASELLGYESAVTVVPAYYDVLLDTKFSRDADSREMLDIIFGNCPYDPGLVYSNFNKLLYCLYYMMLDKDDNYESYYAKNSASIQKNYDDIFAAYGGKS
jgi:ABC-type glycerol-3-phosphate transport system substrate-binding protein